jgi:hypothetical protein
MSAVKEIPFQSRLHTRLIEQFDNRLKLSKEAHQKDREDAWKRAEDTFMAYMPAQEADSMRKSRRDSGTPQYTTIKIPYSYAMLLTSHTYYTSVFLGRDPIFQMRGRHGEAQSAEMGVESMLDYQVNGGRNLPPLFVWLLDVGKYGVGVLGSYWDKEAVQMSRLVDQPKSFLGIPIPGSTERVMQTTEKVLYEGHRLYNVRPQDFYHDPRVPLWRFQEGEYCIEYDKVGWNKIQQGVQSGRYFNVDILKKAKESGSWDIRDLGSVAVTLAGTDEFSMSTLSKDTPATVDLYTLYWELVPRDWGLGTSDRLEKWAFVIANRKVILSAQPMGLSHGKFPFDVLVYESDGYNLFPRGQLEIMEPMNSTIEWLFNSHMWNVRSVLNNQLVVDPSRLNLKDMESPEPGKLIRLKPAAYGQDVRTTYSQLQVQDITRSNLADVDNVGMLGQRVLGVSDNVMGMVNTGGRKTATEVRNSTSFSANRLKTSCEWFSAQGFSPLATKMLMTTQQLMPPPQKYRIVGNQAEFTGRYMDISAATIEGVYDFVPVDGTLPVDRFAQVNMWNQLLGTISKVPNVMMQYDIAKIFGFVAQLGGIKNISQFKIQVVPDGSMAGAVQQGNAVPLRTNPNEPGQIPGMGATG